MYDILSDEVVQHLEEVLTSPVFRTSRRSCQFLRYIVEAKIGGRADQLKERVVGEEVFGRPPDYDTGQDSIVRVKACEVRRRLAQYYDLHPEAAIRIEVPSGAYAPRFHRGSAAAVAPAASQPEPARRRRLTWVAVPAAIALLAGCLMAWRLHGASQFLSFWEPFVADSDRLTLYVPAANTRIAAGEFLGVGDARALMVLYAFFQRRGKTPQVRLAGSTNFAELRGGPGVFIDGLTNPWTPDLLQQGRFVFAGEEGVFGIRDHETNKFICQQARNQAPGAIGDCVVVTRIAHSGTGHPLLAAAGLGHSGALAAGEFLTRADWLEPVLRKLPSDWEKRDLQIVFRAEVVGDHAGAPQVLATHVW